MNEPGRHNKCQDGEACTGRGCRAYTGKTQRKKNWLRPKANKHEGTRGYVSPSQQKKVKK